MPFLSEILEKININKTGVVNVKMVITEEKILSNIEKVQKMINPRSKKQIIQLEEDSYFKDLIDSIKTYLVEYPKKKNFPRSVYKASYDLVEFATNQFEENTKKIEELIIQREKNIALAYELKETLSIIKEKTEGWEDTLGAAADKYSEDIYEALDIISKDNKEETESALKLVDARINNLESNFHIEIDMERIEDKSKALSYIGIEIAEALKYIPTPVDEIIGVSTADEENIIANSIVAEPEDTKEEKVIATVANSVAEESITEENVVQELEQVVSDIEDTFLEETRFEAKPSLWQRIKNSKFVRTIKYIMQIRVVLDYPALPEGKDN